MLWHSPSLWTPTTLSWTPSGRRWSIGASGIAVVKFGAMAASKFINTQHEAQTTKQDQKIPQAREKERRHDSADRLLGALHTRELNRTSNPTYALRGWEMRVQSLGNRRASIQPVARMTTSRTTILLTRTGCWWRGWRVQVEVEVQMLMPMRLLPTCTCTLLISMELSTLVDNSANR